MKLETENVRFIETKLIEDSCLPDVPDEAAPKVIAYIDGVHTMAKEVIKAIIELGGK